MYTIEYIDTAMDERLDKIGSDYFPLPVKFRAFEQATWDFIRETTGFAEATQEISDDLHTLVRERNLTLNQFPYPEAHKFFCQHPTDYHRLITARPLYEIPALGTGGPEQRAVYDNTIMKKLQIKKWGQNQIVDRNPHTEATEEYPVLYRRASQFLLEFQKGLTRDYDVLEIIYYKEPTFGDIELAESFAVDLPELSVQKIMDRACSALRFRTGDDHAPTNYQFDQTFGKRRG